MRCSPRANLSILAGILLFASPVMAQENLVANGSFHLDKNADGQPDHWTTSGTEEIKQTLSITDGPDGLKAARLECNQFVGGSPASHAMICQTGQITVKKGQWYRLSWQAKARDMQINAVRIALSDTSSWSNTGLSYSIPVGQTWRKYEHAFQAEQDLAAADGRLQFWFSSTGTFWLADVVLEPVADLQHEYHPQISTKDVTNFIPNSSFECGTAGWGSYNPDMSTWAGNVFRLIGDIDQQVALHGNQSLRVHVAKRTAPRFMWDWFELVNEKILVPMVAHKGWVPVVKGQSYVFSCYLKADQPNVPARLMVRQGERARSRQIQVGPKWQRFFLPFRADQGFVWVGAGPDLRNADMDAATVWIDALQLEESEEATRYRPRTSLETQIETGVTGNTFLNPAQGMSVRIVGRNHTDRNMVVRGELEITDFFDQRVHSQQVEFMVPAGKTTIESLAGLMAGRTGFFRVNWLPGNASAMPQRLRCMVIESYSDDDSVFGMNHAYGWPFLLRLSKHAGLTWWRDWSVKWHEVEPSNGQFDFSGTDPQIDRVIDEGLNLEIMFPFPSCDWSTTADIDEIKKVEPDRYRHRVMTYACAPNSERDFQDYIAQGVRQYRDRVRYFQVFNEPVYTHYSLPHRLGYTVQDYIRWLNLAADTIRAEYDQAVIVGGMGIWASSSWTHDFVKAGGLAKVDILDLHNYPVTADPESYESDIAELANMMRKRGQVRPMWLTEYGCYADDDPYRTPQQVGDSAMSKSLWPSEREAAQALVQSAAAFFSHGLRKIFLHAGSCGPINGSTAGGVFFEYGGAPRKMLPAVWAFSRLMDADFVPVLAGDHPADRRVYLFKVKRGTLAIVWTREQKPISVTVSDDVTVLDIMGNPLNNHHVNLTGTPVYFLTKTLTPKQLKSILSNSP